MHKTHKWLAAILAAILGIGVLTGVIVNSATADPPGATRNFDDFSTSTDPNADVAAMNSWAASLTAASPHPTVQLPCATRTISTSIQLWSGLALEGGCPRDVREYTTGSVLKWNGPSGSSMFVYTGTQTGQGYPSDGSPRNIDLSYILFQGTSTTNFVTPYEPTTYGQTDPATGRPYNQGHVWWMSRFHSVGWMNWNKVLHGWIDGTTISGAVHLQGAYDTPFNLGGSENYLFSHEAHAFMDAAAAYPLVANAKPFIISYMTESDIGKIMVTARQGAYCLNIAGGYSSNFSLSCDAQDSDPMYGAGIRITGGEGHVISGASLKGMLSQPSSTDVTRRAWITVTGGRDHVIQDNRFTRHGSALPPATAPLVWVGGTATQVAYGLNAGYGFGGTQKHIAQSAAGKLISTDPRVAVDIAA
jgi:hypothetical protein